MENIYAVSTTHNLYSIHTFNYLRVPNYMAVPKVAAPEALIDFTKITPLQIDLLSTAYNLYGRMVNHLTLPQLFYLQV